MSSVLSVRLLGASLVTAGALLAVAPASAALPAPSPAVVAPLSVPTCAVAKTLTVAPATVTATPCVTASMDTVASVKVVLKRSSARSVSGVKVSAVVRRADGVIVAERSCDYSATLNALPVGTTRTTFCQAVLTTPQRGARYFASSWMSGRDSLGRTVNVSMWSTPTVTSP